MIEFQLTSSSGTRIRIEFTNKEIDHELRGSISNHDILVGAEKNGMDKDRLIDIKHVYVRTYRPTECTLDLAMLVCLECIGFEKGSVGLKKMVLPTLQRAYKVVNIPLSLEYVLCSSYATITNMDELLESDTELLMKSSGVTMNDISISI